MIIRSHLDLLPYMSSYYNDFSISVSSPLMCSNSTFATHSSLCFKNSSRLGLKASANLVELSDLRKQCRDSLIPRTSARHYLELSTLETLPEKKKGGKIGFIGFVRLNRTKTKLTLFKKKMMLAEPVPCLCQINLGGFLSFE